MSNKGKPHKHADYIHAFADGYKIETRTIPDGIWVITDKPAWHRDDLEFRVYDSLRDIKIAFLNGKTIQFQYRDRYECEWYDRNITNNTMDIFNYTGVYWRIKPDNFIIDEWVVFDGSSPFRYNQLCNDRMDLRKATKEEVLNASNYDGTATGEEFPFEKGDWVIHKNKKGYNVIQYGVHSTSISIEDLVYATKKEIEDSYLWKMQQPKEYVPLEWEDRELQKAGALIAAEIDRINRMNNK